MSPGPASGASPQPTEGRAGPARGLDRGGGGAIERNSRTGAGERGATRTEHRAQLGDPRIGGRLYGHHRGPAGGGRPRWSVWRVRCGTGSPIRPPTAVRKRAGNADPAGGSAHSVTEFVQDLRTRYVNSSFRYDLFIGYLVNNARIVELGATDDSPATRWHGGGSTRAIVRTAADPEADARGTVTCRQGPRQRRRGCDATAAGIVTRKAISSGGFARSVTRRV